MHYEITAGSDSNIEAVDIGELYGLLARRLERIVRIDVRAPDAVIEDACSFAWSRLLDHRDRIQRETVVPWLARTAVHEAFKLLRRDRRELSLEAAIEQIGQPPPSLRGPTPEELMEERERLAGLRRLPERQQRILWLQAFGLSYAEIAAREGCTLRTVERQLLRAKQRVREPELG
jgi:RNA polymerase sigma factor (sigma-70 family)